MLSPSEFEKDLGTIPFGIPHSFTYTIFNSCDLDIRPEIQLGCGSCTTATIGKVPAKSSAVMNVVFTPNSRGNNIKRISIYHTTNQNNKPTREELVVKFKANVV